MRHDYIISNCSYCCADTIHRVWGRTEDEKGYCQASTRCAVCGATGGYGRPKGHPKILSIYSEKYGVTAFLTGLDCRSVESRTYQKSSRGKRPKT
jgi:hypothetical protein